VLAGLLVLTVVVAVTFGAVRTYRWIISAPPVHRQDALSRLRRSVHVRVEAENLFCRSCQTAVAGPSGYCSDACAA